MARILLQNVTKIFDGEVTAVSDLNLEVADGEFMVIVGPSGCGKTTTLRMIAGLERATSGEIHIAGTLANDLSPKDRDVAMVFQNYALYPHMTAYQNMAFALRMRGLSREQTKIRVIEAAGLLGIENLLNRKPAALSGGQRQRVALGRAIVRRPRAFLFDEPLSNLDAGLRRAMRAELKALHRRLQTTTVYVTHDQAEAMSLGGRISVMHDGAVQQTDEPTKVYARPANIFVAGFVGTPSMNFFRGRLEFSDGALRFSVDGESIMMPLRLRAALQEHRDREMILGVRPEDTSPKAFPGRAENAISGTVEFVEPAGVRADVLIVNRGGQRFLVSVDSHTRISAGDSVRVHINIEKVHVFEAEGSGRNVALPNLAR